MTLARRALIASPLALLLPRVWAGAQVEEPLADAVRATLAAAVNDAAPPKPSFDRMEDRLAYLRWLVRPAKGSRSARLNTSAHRISRNGLVRKPPRRDWKRPWCWG
jgi:hypothetical protein